MSSTPRLDKETMPREKTGSKEEKRGEEKRRERGGEGRRVESRGQEELAALQKGKSLPRQFNK